MNKIEGTLNTFQSSVLDILGAIRNDMSEMMRPRALNALEDASDPDDNYLLKCLIPLDTMDKLDTIEAHLLETTFKENFVSIIYFSLSHLPF